jgi:hypothetical protein
LPSRFWQLWSDIGDHRRHVASDVQAINIEGSGHWAAEEKPADVADALLKFLPAAC